MNMHDTSVGYPTVKALTVEGCDDYSTCPFPRRMPQPDPEAPWFILTSEPNRERTLMAHLVGRGVRAFWATELRRKKQGRAAGWRAESMFPGIVFAKLPLVRTVFDRVASCPGFMRFMMETDQRYAILDDQVVDNIRFHVVSGLDTREIPTGKKNRVVPFQPQQNVTFKEGPFGGLMATITAVDPKGRISLLLDLFGRSTPINVDADEIAAA